MIEGSDLVFQFFLLAIIPLEAFLFWRNVQRDEEEHSEECKQPLLILDLNKVLLFRSFLHDNEKRYDDDYVRGATIVGQHITWKRPHLDHFLDYVFENFTVAVWSSASSKNVNAMCDVIFGNRVLLFKWSQNQCEKIAPHPGTESKPFLFRKDLVRVWNTYGEYDESNTLIMDDCPYKMTQNPALNVISPQSWTVECKDDWYLRYQAIVDLEQRLFIL